MKKQTKSFLSLLTALVFAITQIQPNASASMPEVNIHPSFELNIPSDLGQIESISQGDGPLLIHIQDAHGNFEAQKNIQGILHYLKDTYGIDTVLLEGSAQALEPDMLRFFPDNRELTMRIAENLTREALVKGPELFLLEEPSSAGYGIENAAVYRQNGKAFSAVLTQKEKTQGFIDDMDRQIKRLTSPYLNKDLRNFLKRRESFENKEISLSDWLAFIQDQVESLFQMNLGNSIYQLEWPMLVRLYKIREFEKTLDAAAYPKEKEKFLTVVRRRLENSLYQKIELLLNEPLSSRHLASPDTEVLFEQMTAALTKDFTYADYPNVKRFIGHLILRSEIKGDLLMREMARMSDLLASGLASNDVERQILSLLKDHSLLQKLFALELTPEDYQALLARREDIRPDHMVLKFKEVNLSGRVRDTEFDHLDDINQLFDSALNFYKTVQARDEYMLANVEKRLSEEGKDRAVVITGGFHARPFENYFTAKNYTYALIAPKITTTDGRDVYVQAALESEPVNQPEVSTRMLASYMEPFGETRTSTLPAKHMAEVVVTSAGDMGLFSAASESLTVTPALQANVFTVTYHDQRLFGEAVEVDVPVTIATTVKQVETSRVLAVAGKSELRRLDRRAVREVPKNETSPGTRTVRAEYRTADVNPENPDVPALLRIRLERSPESEQLIVRYYTAGGNGDDPEAVPVPDDAGSLLAAVLAEGGLVESAQYTDASGRLQIVTAAGRRVTADLRNPSGLAVVINEVAADLSTRIRPVTAFDPDELLVNILYAARLFERTQGPDAVPGPPRDRLEFQTYNLTVQTELEKLKTNLPVLFEVVRRLQSELQNEAVSPLQREYISGLLNIAIPVPVSVTTAPSDEANVFVRIAIDGVDQIITLQPVQTQPELITVDTPERQLVAAIGSLESTGRIRLSQPVTLVDGLVQIGEGLNAVRISINRDETFQLQIFLGLAVASPVPGLEDLGLRVITADSPDRLEIAADRGITLPDIERILRRAEIRGIRGEDESDHVISVLYALAPFVLVFLGAIVVGVISQIGQNPNPVEELPAIIATDGRPEAVVPAGFNTLYEENGVLTAVQTGQQYLIRRIQRQTAGNPQSPLLSITLTPLDKTGQPGQEPDINIPAGLFAEQLAQKVYRYSPPDIIRTGQPSVETAESPVDAVTMQVTRLLDVDTSQYEVGGLLYADGPEGIPGTGQISRITSITPADPAANRPAVVHVELLQADGRTPGVQNVPLPLSDHFLYKAPETVNTEYEQFAVVPVNVSHAGINDIVILNGTNVSYTVVKLNRNETGEIISVVLKPAAETELEPVTIIGKRFSELFVERVVPLAETITMSVTRLFDVDVSQYEVGGLLYAEGPEGIPGTGQVSRITSVTPANLSANTPAVVRVELLQENGETPEAQNVPLPLSDHFLYRAPVTANVQYDQITVAPVNAQALELNDVVILNGTNISYTVTKLNRNETGEITSVVLNPLVHTALKRITVETERFSELFAKFVKPSEEPVTVPVTRLLGVDVSQYEVGGLLYADGPEGVPGTGQVSRITSVTPADPAANTPAIIRVELLQADGETPEAQNVPLSLNDHFLYRAPETVDTKYTQITVVPVNVQVLKTNDVVIINGTNVSYTVAKINRNETGDLVSVDLNPLEKTILQPVTVSAPQLAELFVREVKVSKRSEFRRISTESVDADLFDRSQPPVVQPGFQFTRAAGIAIPLTEINTPELFSETPAGIVFVEFRGGVFAFNREVLATEENRRIAAQQLSELLGEPVPVNVFKQLHAENESDAIGAGIPVYDERLFQQVINNRLNRAANTPVEATGRWYLSETFLRIFSEQNPRAFRLFLSALSRFRHELKINDVVAYTAVQTGNKRSLLEAIERSLRNQQAKITAESENLVQVLQEIDTLIAEIQQGLLLNVIEVEDAQVEVETVQELSSKYRGGLVTWAMDDTFVKSIQGGANFVLRSRINSKNWFFIGLAAFLTEPAAALIRDLPIELRAEALDEYVAQHIDGFESRAGGFYVVMGRLIKSLAKHQYYAIMA